MTSLEFYSPSYEIGWCTSRYICIAYADFYAHDFLCVFSWIINELRFTTILVLLQHVGRLAYLWKWPIYSYDPVETYICVGTSLILERAGNNISFTARKDTLPLFEATQPLISQLRSVLALCENVCYVALVRYVTLYHHFRFCIVASWDVTSASTYSGNISHVIVNDELLCP